MRIISGKFKGKVLKEFELPTTRPTSDLVRGALFNIIGSKIVDSTFLDLFSGTGAVGIEALSRGAKQVYFVDSNSESINLIKKNLSLVNCRNYQIFNFDFLEALKNLSNQYIKLDIIFIDPPYLSTFAEQALKLILKLNILNDNGLIFWEHDKEKLPLLNNFKTKKYGKKFITTLTKEDLKIFINIQNNE